MAGIAVVNVSVAGGLITGGGQDFVKVNGNPVAIVGDRVAPHGAGAHANAEMVTGSTLVTISGNPVCKAGDTATCNHQTNGVDFVDLD